MTALDSPLHGNFESVGLTHTSSKPIAAAEVSNTAFNGHISLVNDSVSTGHGENSNYFSMFDGNGRGFKQVSDADESILEMVELVNEGVGDPLNSGPMGVQNFYYSATPDGSFLEKIGRIEAENARLQNAKFEQEYTLLKAQEKDTEQHNSNNTNTSKNDQTLQLAQNYNVLSSGLQQMIGKSLQSSYTNSLDPQASVLDQKNVDQLNAMLFQLPVNAHGVIGAAAASKLAQEINNATESHVATLAEMFNNQSPMVQNATRESLTALLKGSNEETAGNASIFLQKIMLSGNTSNALLIDESISSLDQPGAPEWDTTNAEYLIEQLKASGRSGPEVDNLIAKAQAKIEAAQEFIAQQNQRELEQIQERLDAQQAEENKRIDDLETALRDEDLKEKENDAEDEKTYLQQSKSQGFNSILDRQLEHYTSVKIQSADGREAMSLMHGHDDDISATLSVLETLDTSALGAYQGGLGGTRFSSETDQSSLPTVSPMQVIKSTNPVSAFDFDDDGAEQIPQRPGSRV